MATAERLDTESTVDLIKRILVGRRMPTHRLEHTLLPKVLALPVFSSDALSSVAYATEQILFVLLAASANAAHLVMPISFGIAALMVIVVASYRQTVRAYPSGGGAYIVSKENLGVFPGLVAAAALLTDYVLTVSVSVVAGVFAITSAVSGLNHLKVELSIGFVGFITLANLRGVRESGTVFAIPTYGFIASIFVLIGTGLVKCAVSACPAAVTPPPAQLLPIGTAAFVPLFVILHAFASGSTALTGVEAISNGVPAFRRPQAKNAADTLAIMGAIAVTMFLGISFLASRAHPLPSEAKSVVAQVADGVFHGGLPYYLVQVFTAAILILAANTSYQDFPRLSSILARDHFLPRQFENRGDRLVFSNGVIVLAILSSILIWAFDANLDRLIQLYVVGVFTSFTLSQTGMVRHWRKVAREHGRQVRGWRRSMVINAVGAVATALVLVIVVETKFLHGAWIVIAAMPVIVAGFYGIHRHYEGIQRQLRRGGAALAEAPKNTVVLYVEDLNAATARAVGYVRSFAGRDFRAVHVPTDRSPPDVADRWQAFCRTDVELEVLPGERQPVAAVLEYVRAIPREEGDFITVVIPELLTKRSLLSAVRRRMSFILKLRLLREPQVVITDVPLLQEPSEPKTEVRPLIPEHVEVLVFVAAVHDASIRAINYARSLKAPDTRALYFAFDLSEIDEIQAAWERAGIPVALDIVEAPFRDLTGPVLQEIRAFTSRPNAVAVVIVPELVVKKWWHHFLHNQRPLFLKRLLLFEPGVILTSVPYQLQ
ncbi:MAG: APC family permease [Actinobacteria bacterium]|nr:MAG: APC family permease [Actinomycetota bacterium]